MIYYLLTFANTHSAMLTQSHLERYAPVFMMPTLREISASCGISIRFSPDHREIVLEAMKTLNLSQKMFQLYKIQEENGINSPVPLNFKSEG